MFRTPLALSSCLIIFAPIFPPVVFGPPLSAIKVCENRNDLVGTLAHRPCKTMTMESPLDALLS